MYRTNCIEYLCQTVWKLILQNKYLNKYINEAIDFEFVLADLGSMSCDKTNNSNA